MFGHFAGVPLQSALKWPLQHVVSPLRSDTSPKFLVVELLRFSAFLLADWDGLDDISSGFMAMNRSQNSDSLRLVRQQGKPGVVGLSAMPRGLMTPRGKSRARAKRRRGLRVSADAVQTREFLESLLPTSPASSGVSSPLNTKP